MAKTMTPESAAATHDRMVAGYHAQRLRFAPAGDMWSGCAGSFRPDLNAPLAGFHAHVAGFVQPDDALVDVGGGAGRLSLPLACRCREVICVDPSPAMADVFSDTAREAGIGNARYVRSSWLEASGIEGDVSLVAHVTYFVPAIVPFIEKVNGATRRRVVVVTRTAPPPNQVAPLFERFRGEAFARVPGYEALLTVLRAMDIDAEIIDAGSAATSVTAPAGATREETAKNQAAGASRLGWVREDEAERYREMIERDFDEFFIETEDGFRPRTAMDVRDLLITWETGR